MGQGKNLRLIGGNITITVNTCLGENHRYGDNSHAAPIDPSESPLAEVRGGGFYARRGLVMRTGCSQPFEHAKKSSLLIASQPTPCAQEADFIDVLRKFARLYWRSCVN